MNIQIYGKNKCFDTKKAQRWFQERRIKFQAIDLTQKGLSPRELQSVKQAVGGLDNLIDPKAKEAATLKYMAYDSQKEERLLEDPALLRTPIVRNGKQATVGYCPEVWETWE
ncbi:MAG: ArsC family transcriptional regulator [Clostridia bacterium]|nr:ArsC family transcriptional regulator [Clostridia bacterium]